MTFISGFIHFSIYIIFLSIFKWFWAMIPSHWNISNPILWALVGFLSVTSFKKVIVHSIGFFSLQGVIVIHSGFTLWSVACGLLHRITQNNFHSWLESGLIYFFCSQDLLTRSYKHLQLQHKPSWLTFPLAWDHRFGKFPTFWRDSNSRRLVVGSTIMWVIFVYFSHWRWLSPRQ